MRVASEWSDTEAGREVQVSWGSDRKQDNQLDTRIGKAKSSNTSFEQFGCHETRIVHKALYFQNSFCPHSHLRL